MADKPLDPQTSSIVIPLVAEDVSRGTYEGNQSYLDQWFVNCWPQLYKNPVDGSATVAVVKRPGSQTSNNAAIMSPTEGGHAQQGISGYASRVADQGVGDDLTCMCNMTVTQLYDVHVAAFYDINNNSIYIVQYRPIAGTTTKIGTVAAGTANPDDQVFISEFTSGDSLLPAIAVNYLRRDQAASTGYYANSTAGVFTAASLNTITFPNVPVIGVPDIMIGPFQYMNSRLFIMSISGKIWNCSQTSGFNCDPATWNSNANVTSTQYPDRGTGIFRYKHLLAAFGQDSVEFWTDAANPPPGSPLERTDQAFIKFGCSNPKLIINVDDVLYWIAGGSTDTIGLWKLENYVPTKLSTTREDLVIQNNPNYRTGQYSVEALLLLGRKHILLNGFTTRSQASFSFIPLDAASLASDDAYYRTNSITDFGANILCYNLEDKMWWGMNPQSDWHGQGNGWLYYDTVVLPTGLFPDATHGGLGQQYFFRRYAYPANGYFGAGGIPFSHYFASTIPLNYQTAPSGGNYVEAQPLVAGGTYPIACTFQLNAIKFQTTKRKRFSKISLLSDDLSVGQSANAGLYFIWQFENTMDSLSPKVRRVALPRKVGQRYSINNLGMGRTILVAVATKNAYGLRAQGIELDVVQGNS
jgi:hypothetical protein